MLDQYAWGDIKYVYGHEQRHAHSVTKLVRNALLRNTGFDFVYSNECDCNLARRRLEEYLGQILRWANAVQGGHAPVHGDGGMTPREGTPYPPISPMPKPIIDLSKF